MPEVRKGDLNMTDPETRRLILSARAAILLPAVWSGVTGGLVGATVAASALVAQAERPLEIGLTAGTATALAAWGVAMFWWLRQWRRVRDNPAQVVQPRQAQPRTSVKVEYKNKTGNVLTFDHIDTATPEQVRQIARMIASGRGVTYPDILKVFGGSRADANDFRDEMINKLHYFEWRNPESPQQGIAVTAKGRVILAHFATGQAENTRPAGNTREHMQNNGDYDDED